LGRPPASAHAVSSAERHITPRPNDFVVGLAACVAQRRWSGSAQHGTAAHIHTRCKSRSPHQERIPASPRRPSFSPRPSPHPNQPVLLLCSNLSSLSQRGSRLSPLRASMGKSDKKDKKRKRDSSGSSDSSDRSLGQMARARVHPGLAYIYICQPMPVHCSMQGASGS